MANDFAAAAKPDRQTAIFGRVPRAKAKHLASRNFPPKSVLAEFIAAERVEPQEIF
jgi:hypothetical protein